MVPIRFVRLVRVEMSEKQKRSVTASNTQKSDGSMQQRTFTADMLASGNVRHSRPELTAL